MSASLTRAELNALDLSTVQWTSRPDAGGSDGVEIAELPGGAVAVRSADEPGTVQRYTEEEWRAFLLSTRDGEFDLDGLSTPPQVG
ncbi:DUF397 domain-containing protein [Streptomyces sp. SBC-4]|nr:DUF397 domain-containing protein [Streptomyces sp. SBC-4]MDV5145427.1 DUF397 domain-containing protein [Streptomyces sp. SBC-4]